MISPYILLFFLIIIGLILSRCFKRYTLPVYHVLIVLVALFLSFRCWQGTDYNMYKWLFDMAPTFPDFSNNYFSSEVHGEFSWKLMMSLAKFFGITFELLIAIMSCAMCYCLHRFISRYSSDPVLSLLISYPNLILVYFASGLRQGLVIAIFLGFLVELIEKDKLTLFFIASVFLATVHSSAVIFILLPLYKRADFKTSLLIGGIGLSIGLIPVIFPAVNSILSQLPFIGFYVEGKGSVGISLINVARRLLVFGFIVFTYIKVSKSNDDERVYSFKLLAHMYFFGFALYLLFISSTAAAARFYAPLQMLEIALLPLSITLLGQRVTPAYLLITLLNFALLGNVLSSFIVERGYYNDTWLTYPYYTILTPIETVESDRPSSFDLP